MPTRQKRCRKGQTHYDGIALVEYLMNNGGKVQRTNDQIAGDLGFTKNIANYLLVDTGRFIDARNHVKDGMDGTQPCCGYRLNYKTTTNETTLALVDPNGGLIDHTDAVVQVVIGWLVREQQHQTENLRGIEMFESLGTHARKVGDLRGSRLCERAAIDIERDGTVHPTTMAELMVWLNDLRSK